MKSQDPRVKHVDFAAQRTFSMENRQDGVFNYINDDRIISTHKHKNKKIYYFDNYEISLSYGQANIEKCLIVILMCLTFSATLIYKYFFDLHETILYIFIGSCFVDLIVTLFYLYFLFKLKAAQIFNNVPIGALDFNDLLILVNFITKIILFIFFCLHYTYIGLTGIALFTFKLLLDIYYTLISVKFLMLCPCSIYVQEITNKIWLNIKYYVCCCDVEQIEPDNHEYTKIEEIESFY
jgi:hypothetical protein